MYGELFRDFEAWHIPVGLSAIAIPCLTTGLALGTGNWWVFLGGIVYAVVAMLSMSVKVKWRGRGW